MPQEHRLHAAPRPRRAGELARRRRARAAQIRRRRLTLAGAIIVLAAVVISALGGAGAPVMRSSAQRSSGGSAPSSSPAPVSQPKRSQIPLPASTSKLLGQRIMVGLGGTSANASLLRRVRRGEVGAVILFEPNIVSRSQTAALTASLQRAARAGGNPPLLIAIDQEGGQVKRIASGAPTLSPPQIAATGKVSVAHDQGVATGRLLRRYGIDMDLAPVSDVPTFGGAFIWRQGRAFSFSADEVARYASAFAFGVQAGRAAATAKHFPGVGSAGIDTDFKLDDLHPTAAQRAAALRPYLTMIPRGLDAVMVSTARYPAYDASGAPAALSKPIVEGLLRHQLGFGGVAITDSLGTPTGHSETAAGVLAARAGADILLFTDSAPAELDALRSAIAGGRIARSDAAAAYRRIIALKRKLS
jgi:beta-N-acetylhexosaminidase